MNYPCPYCGGKVDVATVGNGAGCAVVFCTVCGETLDGYYAPDTEEEATDAPV